MADIAIEMMLVPKAKKKVYAGTSKRKKICIHQTGNTARGADVLAHAKLQLNNSRAASWNVTVDDKRAIQSYLDTDRTWHAGARGADMIAIEICVNSDGDYFAAVVNGASVASQKMKANNLALSDVIQHHDVTRKNCPEQIRGNKDGIDWSDFLRLVASGGTVIPTPVPPVPPKPTPPVIGPPVTPPAVQEFPAIALWEDQSWGSVTTKALQKVIPKAYNNGVDLIADGDFGPVTKKAVQRWLKALGYYSGNIDGDFGAMSARALQSFLKAKGLYAGYTDGKIGPLTVLALQKYLNQQRLYMI